MNKIYNKKTLENGLRLITVPMASTQTVTVLVLVGTGSRYERREINGISHFLEHMMFKGTTARPTALQISTELDAIGAEYNAFTSKEYTGYFVKCAAGKFDVALDVIADIFQNSVFADEEIARERGPIKEEINMYFDNPMRYVPVIFDELVYGDQPLGWDTAGKKEIIDRLTRQNFLDYFHSHYFAKNAIVSVAGNINPEIVEAKVKEKFGRIREEGISESLPDNEKQDMPRVKILSKKTDQSHIIVGFRSLSYLDEDFPKLETMAVVLGGGMSSRLFSEVRERRGLAYRVSAGLSAYHETGDFCASAGLNNDKLIPALTVILEQFKRLATEPISAGELAKAKDYIKGTTAIALESSDAQASFHADQELLQNRILTVEEKLARIDAVSSHDIIELASKIIVPQGLNLALIGPYEADEKNISDLVLNWR